MLIIEKLKVTEEMSEAEAAIAAYLLEHGRDLKRYSIRDLADSAYASPATVVRLCKKLGLSGFTELKSRLLDELAYFEQKQDEVDANFPFSREDSLMRTANRISQLHMQTVADTMKLLRFGDLQKAIRLLQQSRRVYVFSFGTSLNQAESFLENMLKIGREVVIQSNLNYQIYQAKCMSARDLAIAISYSGETEKILFIAQICHKNHVPLIAISSYGENTLTSYSDCKLTISTKEHLFDNMANFSMHVSINLLLDVLYSGLFLVDYDTNYRHKIDVTKQFEFNRHSQTDALMRGDLWNPERKTC
ncbi:transcriptional regulator, RpiR family [Coriobacterium glomerans PW2]|uniref:Transcriptional regulator, RpiR family n=1 Tax=Coriobacterium glomerans (strain ATCC 49209 / DSM 20642 / JCM 10262 / PW2) TaxID=700015 RepID=F2NA99_CORGP|nr:MurR/RpiR family transcriptional regulator [Coriobacterium glomerans]AEB06285.1 transcriptional regulator, RpiR family [Coriobacterium glomerans PW2]